VRVFFKETLLTNDPEINGVVRSTLADTGQLPRQGPAHARSFADAQAGGHRSKAARSVYESGKRSGAWIKIKNHRTGVYRVGGWIPNTDGGVDALLIGKDTGAGRFNTLARWRWERSQGYGLTWNDWNAARRRFMHFGQKRARHVKNHLSVLIRSLDTDSTWLREATLISVMKQEVGAEMEALLQNMPAEVTAARLHESRFRFNPAQDHARGSDSETLIGLKHSLVTLLSLVVQ
jgi:hypothetical protein